MTAWSLVSPSPFFISSSRFKARGSTFVYGIYRQASLIFLEHAILGLSELYL